MSKGLWWSFRYNFGSLALGSLILAIVWIVRVAFEYIDKKMKSLVGNNQLASCISNAIRCCLDCCHRFIKFLNTNAYVQVALTGQNFCASAMSAFVLALKNSASFFITNGVGALIGFIGRMSIAGANTFLAYLMMLDHSKDIYGYIAPLAIVFVISFVLSSIIMEIYQITAITLLQCLYTDVDLCN